MSAVRSRARITFKNILFCTDFAPDSSVAFSYAVELARHFGAKLHALYVRNPDDYVIVFPEGRSIPPGFTVEQARKELSDLLDPLSDIAREVLVEQGEVWPTVASVIEKNAIDLVVLRTRGRTGITKLVLGSHAEQIFRGASCPVLILGPRSAHLPHGSSIQEILYATDFSPESVSAAPYAVSLAEEYQARLTLLHVISPQEPSDLLTAEQLTVSSERIMRSVISPEAEIWCEPRYIVEQGDPAEKVLDLAALKRVGLIVLGVRGPSVLGATHLPGTTAYKIIAQTTCPVLTVRNSMKAA